MQAPVFHVNGDDPEAACRVIQLAFAFRQRFAKDVVVDMVCYRRFGHNEGDEPAFTQPRMYELIDARRSVRKLYTETLVNRGDLTLEQCEATLEDYRARLEAAFASTHESAAPDAPVFDRAEQAAEAERPVATAVARDRLLPVVTALNTYPESFTPHPKLARILGQRAKAFAADQVDWALAEALAFGTLLQDGTAVRVAGQDTRRGTFSQRHAVLVDFNDEHEYTPLGHIAPEQAPFMIYDSVLSEFAALGFEYGYSVADPDTLVCWEAQFGDFANGGQTIIDQFIVAAQDKWGQMSSLALLLPHGFEGQGPEHSSARLERFLTLCADDNMRVTYPTTAAQYFHVLRRQMLAPRRLPLVVLTPKRYLRMPATTSSVAELTDGGFRTTIVDDGGADPAAVTRIIACTGKIGHELIARRNEIGATAAIVRVEQLYPVPSTEFTAIVARYPSATEIVEGRRNLHCGTAGVGGRDRLGAGRAGEHGRPPVRDAVPPRSRASGRRSCRGSRVRRAPAPRPGAPRCTTPSSRSCSMPRSAPSSNRSPSGRWLRTGGPASPGGRSPGRRRSRSRRARRARP